MLSNEYSQDAPVYDVLVVGGGINGASIARDLAGRGFKVLLCEKDDLAQHTSSCSTKLIHGGLRYLEHMEFALVQKALAEREVLLRSAPHIMWPLRFVMPHDGAMRPAWMIRLGLFLYDHLAQRELLEGSSAIHLRSHPAGMPLKARYTRGFVYSDGWVDDARFVVLCAMDAAERGAEVLTRWACTRAEPVAGRWSVELNSTGGAKRHVQARVLVNATGPWAAQFLSEHCINGASGLERPIRKLRFVKGSHIVVMQRFSHDHAYIFQNADKRIIFAIPYEGDFTLIGTTDVECADPPGEVNIDAAEVDYLCQQASHYFEAPISPSDVVWQFSGVRPLLNDASDDPSQITRDYELELTHDGAVMLTVWGGKITTCRKLAAQAADRLEHRLGKKDAPWTHQRHAYLPGGDLRDWVLPSSRPENHFLNFRRALVARYPKVCPVLVQRLARAYGTRATAILSSELGQAVAGNLHEAELQYLYQHEWARCGEDVLWRRSKLGLHLSDSEREAVQAWCRLNWPD